MINLLKDTELKYVECYSEKKKYKSLIKFWDNNFRNIYANNLTIFQEEFEFEEILEFLIKEIKVSKRKKRRFLNFEVNKNIDRDELRKFNLNPSRVDNFDYMVINTKEFFDIELDETIEIKEVITDKEYESLINISIEDNKSALGNRYAKAKILRKVEVYKDKSNDLKAFLIYKDTIPVGSCELLIDKNIAKLEDIGILKEYRGKGIGTFTLKYMLKLCNKNNVEYLYVITERFSDAKRVYERLGFKKIGDKTQIIFDF